MMDFKEISSSKFEEMVSNAIINADSDKLLLLFNSLANQINSDKENRYLIYLIPIFYNKIEKEQYEIEHPMRFNFNLNEFLEEFGFEFSPERNKDSGYWESTSDYTWTDPNNNTEGSFLQLLLGRIQVTVEDINANGELKYWDGNNWVELTEKSNNQYIENIAATFLWFSMVKFIKDKVHKQGYDNKDLAKLIWTVVQDPIADEINDVLQGEIYGFESFFQIVAPSMLGFNLDHYDWEKNDEMQGYGDYVHDFKAIAQDILNMDIFDII